MILNLDQQRAVESGEAVAMTVGGTDCVLVRRDVYIGTAPTNRNGQSHANGVAKKPEVEPNDDFDPEPPEWLDVEKDLYFPMTVPSYPLGKVTLVVQRGEPNIILPEELPDE